jgi:TPR repeat protein
VPTSSSDQPESLDPKRWQIPGVSAEARNLARMAAAQHGIGVGDWLEAVIRRRSAITPVPASDEATLPDEIAETLDALATRIATQAADVETLVVPLAQSVDRLDERVRTAAASSATDDGERTGHRTSGDVPFYRSVDPAADQPVADATIAGELSRLFEDSERDAPAPTDTPPRRPPKGDPAVSSRRTMLVAAGIVVALFGVGAALYQWSQTSSVPVDNPPVAMAPGAAPDRPVPPTHPESPTPQAPAPATGETAPASTVETVELEPPPAPASTPVSPTRPEPGPADPSHVRPPPPSLAETDPLAAVYRNAAAGEPRAQYDLAVAYIQGRNIPQNNAAAAYWLRQAATAGLAPAQYNLGVMYELGIAGTKDPVESLLWFHSAAEQGHTRAYYALGIAYTEGKSVPADTVTARRWFTKAAEAGVADAQLALGLMFDQGLGGPKDARQAYFWYRRAEIAGNDRAASRIAGLGDRLSDAQRADLNDAVSRAVTPGLARPAASPSTDGPRVAAKNSPDKETVRAAQALLAELGFDPGPADGDAGPLTRAAVSDYQRALGLPVNGMPDADLLAHLREITGAATRR